MLKMKVKEHKEEQIDENNDMKIGFYKNKNKAKVSFLKNKNKTKVSFLKNKNKTKVSFLKILKISKNKSC